MSIPVNGWLHYTYRPQQSPETMNRRPVDRRFDLSFQNASEEDLGQGFKRYTWSTGIRINNHEYVDFRLEAQRNEKVISAGYLTDPIENIYSVQTGPRDPNVMVVILHNASNVDSKVYLWLVVKG
ncbi:hypothetical protein KW850_20265 [Bacillus sp. sid0103]|uniref:hypothetical protein n=1 Tax=Bacillus sp. sid0103 TaxID=2856337 RepID=UPI001C443DC8|nr:hypothetical protein [Bacillus sp. sid0103]MBV7507568.1 hypothetical protein [Bacillus sp. sid0103]